MVILNQYEIQRPAFHVACRIIGNSQEDPLPSRSNKSMFLTVEKYRQILIELGPEFLRPLRRIRAAGQARLLRFFLRLLSLLGLELLSLELVRFELLSLLFLGLLLLFSLASFPLLLALLVEQFLLALVGIKLALAGMASIDFGHGICEDWVSVHEVLELLWVRNHILVSQLRVPSHHVVEDAIARAERI